MKPTPAELLDALLAQGPERPSLSLLTTRCLATLPGVVAEVCAGRGFAEVDLSLIRSPFEVNPALSRRRLVTGLSWLAPALRRQRAVAMNQARDRISALGLQIILWILEEDLVWLGDEAPDLFSRVQEVFVWPEPPMLPPSPSSLFCPLGSPPAPATVPANLRWLVQTLSTPGGRASLPGALGVALARSVIDQLLAEERGPVAWLAMDWLDPERVGQWLRARGDIRVAVVAQGMPSITWPPEVALLLVGLSEDAIPAEFPRPPPIPSSSPPPAFATYPSEPSETDLPGLSLLPMVEDHGAILSSLPSQLPEARSWTVVSPDADWESATALRREGRALESSEARAAWRLSLEDANLSDTGVLSAWASLEGPRSTTGPSAWRSLWTAPEILIRSRSPSNTSDSGDEEELLAQQIVALSQSVAEQIAGWQAAVASARTLRVEILGKGEAVEALRRIPWELLEEAQGVDDMGVARALPDLVPRVVSAGRPRVLFAIARAKQRSAPVVDPWLVWNMFYRVAAKQDRDFDISFALNGTFAELKDLISGAAATGHPYDLLYLDVPGVYAGGGELAQLVFEDRAADTVLEGAPHRVDGSELAWVLREGKVRFVVLSAWDSGEQAPPDAGALLSALGTAGLEGLAGPAEAVSHADLLAAQFGFIGALLEGRGLEETGKAARRAARELATQVSIAGRSGTGAGRATWRFALSEGASGLSRTEGEHPVQPRDPPECLPATPPGGIVGRRMEILWLQRALSKPGMAGMMGMAGQGRSALAAAGARRWLQLGTGRRVSWISVGDRPSSESVAQRLGAALGLAPAEDPWFALVTALDGAPTLLVLDDIEALGDGPNAPVPPETDALLGRLAGFARTEKANLLLIGRSVFLPPDLHADLLWLGGLSPTDGRQMLAARLVASGWEVDEAKARVARLRDDEVDHPATLFGIADFLDETSGPLASREARFNEQQVAAIRPALAKLPPDDRRHLLGVGAFRRVVPLGALVHVLGLPIREVERLVNWMMSAGLIEVAGGCLRLHPALELALGPTPLEAARRWAEAMVGAVSELTQLQHADPPQAMTLFRELGSEILEALRVSATTAKTPDAAARLLGSMDLFEALSETTSCPGLQNTTAIYRKPLYDLAPEPARVNSDLSWLERDLRHSRLTDASARALGLLRRAEAVARHHRSRAPLLLRAQVLAARACRMSGNSSSALRIVQDAERTWFTQKKQGTTAALRIRALIHEESALVHRRLGNAEEANAQLKKYEEIARQIGDRPMQAVLLQHQAALAPSLGSDESVEGDLRRALSAHEQAGDLFNVAHALKNLGYHLLAKGQVKEARETFLRCGALAEAAGLPALVGLSKSGLGRVALQEGNFHSAERHLREAEERLAILKMDTEWGTCLASLGELHLKRRQPEQAATVLRQALDVLSPEGGQTAWRTAFYLYAAEQVRGDSAAAQVAANTALNLYVNWSLAHGQGPPQPDDLREQVPSTPEQVLDQWWLAALS